MSQRNQSLDLRLKELSLSAPSDPAPGNSASLPLRGKRLVCVEYPAVIQNLQRALHSLGGERAVSKTYAHPNRRLELRFRPEDPFCHSVCGNRLDSGNLLLRVRRRVRKTKSANNTNILFGLNMIFLCSGLADFQCLAVHPENSAITSLYDKILLTRPESQEFFEQPLPYFLPPAIFSRLDTPIDYFYRPDLNQKAGLHKNFIGLNRARRPHNCMEAARVIWQRMCVKECDKRLEQHVRERRPIWSRNAVKANVDTHPEKLKLLLPLLAYYMVTGPWRSLWVRLGYDPRKSPESKQYQLLDFRIRCSTKHGYSLSDMPVKPKRTALSYTLPITVNKTAKPLARNPLTMGKKSGTSALNGVCFFAQESAYIFREGMLPPHRQMFYQLCDLHVDRIQKVVNVNQGLEKSCDERDGWCVVGTTDQIRDIISDLIKKVIRSKKSCKKSHREVVDNRNMRHIETRGYSNRKFSVIYGIF
uniref:General transcription factor IIIC, polypeptide 5 n=1 Tax=Neogobius melanostomus TaxID=47308 RepID=A0A8C6UIN9_9GOBI